MCLDRVFSFVLVKGHGAFSFTWGVSWYVRIRAVLFIFLRIRSYSFVIVRFREHQNRPMTTTPKMNQQRFFADNSSSTQLPIPWNNCHMNRIVCLDDNKQIEGLPTLDSCVWDHRWCSRCSWRPQVLSHGIGRHNFWKNIKTNEWSNYCESEKGRSLA